MPITSIICMAAVAFTLGILYVLTRELTELCREIRRLDQEDKLYNEYEEEESGDESCTEKTEP